MFEDKFEKYVEEKWFIDFEREIWINRKTLKKIYEKRYEKINKKTLDHLYWFFRLDKDTFYNKILSKRYPDTESLLWNLIRKKRLEKVMDLHDLSKRIKIERRTLSRVEAWETLPTPNSYTMTHLLSELEFEPVEKEIINNYISSTKSLKKLFKK